MSAPQEKVESTAIVVLPSQETKETPTHRLYRPGTKKLKGGQVTISPGLAWYLKLHSRRWKPAESCAMLIGFKDDKAKKFDIRGAVLCSNPTHSGGYFEMPPREVIKSYEVAEEHHMEIVGVFHSHPSGFEIPSSTDENFMTITPGAWIIYSWTALRCYTLKASRLGTMNVRELPIKEKRTEEKPIIVHAYNWKKTKFPPKYHRFQWPQDYRYRAEAIPIRRVDPDRYVWPPYWRAEENYGIY